MPLTVEGGHAVRAGANVRPASRATECDG